MVVAGKKSFVDNLIEGYRFDVKPNVKVFGTRSVCYYKSEHSLLVSHILTNRVHLLNLSTGKLRWFDHHGTTVRSIQMCEHEIVSASWDSKVCVTNFDTLKPRLILTEKEMGRCPDVAISPDHTYLYSYSYDSDINPDRKSNTVRRWKMETGELRKALKLPGTHLSGRRCGSCVVSGNRLYVVSDSGHLHIYHSTIPVLLAEKSYNDELQSICMSSDSRMVFIGGSEGNIYQCNLSGKRIKQVYKAHRFDITQMLIPRDKPNILITVSFDGTLKIWDVQSLELIQTIFVEGICLWTVTVVDNLLITGGEKGEIWIYDIQNLPEIKVKGKLFIADDSYAYLPSDSDYFYATNLSLMQVRKNDDHSLLEGQYAEYLLNTACNFKIFKDLFSSGSTDLISLKQESCGFYQLTQ